MAAECARNALLQKVVDNKTDSGIDYSLYPSFFILYLIFTIVLFSLIISLNMFV